MEDVTYRDIRIEYDASEMESIYQNGGRDQKVVCKSPYSGCWLAVTNTKMFNPQSGYNKLGYDASNDPYGTFKILTIKDIDITIGKGAVQPAYIVKAEPGSAFGEISISNVRIHSKG